MITLAPYKALAAVAALALAFPASAAEPVAAELFPAGTLAFAEIANPAELSVQIGELVKGSSLEDSIALLHKRKDAATNLNDLQSKRQLAILGLFASPEMMAECKKFRGAAIGLMGFTDAGDPEGALVVLTGESSAAGLAARAFLTMSPSLRRVGEVSKVPVFQYKPPEISYDATGQPMINNGGKPAVENAYGLTYAYTPGLFVVGTSKKAVEVSIKRFLGEEKDSLSSTPLFKKAATANRQTGIFYFVNFPVFAKKYEAANRQKGGMNEPDFYAWSTMLANPKAIHSVSGCVSLKSGGLAATLEVALDPAQKSPLREFLSGPPVTGDLLHSARGQATAVLTVSLPEKNRAAAAIALCDSFAKANGVLGKLPGDYANGLAEKYPDANLNHLLEKTRAVTVVSPAKQNVPKGTMSLPLLVLHADDAQTALAWEAFLPKLMAGVAGAAMPMQASTESIAGTTVYSLPGQALPWNGPIHYAHHGKLVAIGLDRKLVASVLGSEAAGTTPPRTTAEPAVLLGSVSLADVLQALLERPHREGPVVPLEMAEVPRFPNFNNFQVPESVSEDVGKARQEFFKKFGAIPAATISVRRTTDSLKLELFQPRVLAGGLKSVIDSGTLWLDKWDVLSDSRRQFGIEDR